MSVLMVRAKVKPEHVQELDVAAERMFAAIEKLAPEGIRYASGRLPDGVTYVALLQVNDGVENPLPALPEFQAFQAGLQSWVSEPPAAEPLAIVGSYRFA